jgi:uncharacterized membrane protein
LAQQSIGQSRDWMKRGFFILMAACLLLVFFTDERFLWNPDHTEWQRMQPFKWALLVHGPFGAIALLAGPFQFSDRLRARRPALHRAIGWTYVTSVAISAPFAWYIGANFEAAESTFELQVQSALWLLTTAMALACILRRQVELHKGWMMSSYGLSLIFVLDRVPDPFPQLQLSDLDAANLLWLLVVCALIGPHLALSIRALSRRG